MVNIINLESINKLYGNAYVQIPNNIFKKISYSIGEEKSDIRQIAFAYSYIIINSFLYKYSKYVDLEYDTYVQNSDIKESLGYSRTTKTVDYIIKKNGVLDLIGLTETTKSVPLVSYYEYNNLHETDIIKYKHTDTINESSYEYKQYKKIVKNRNYEIKKPIFLFNNDENIGTLFDYSNTHKITIKELLYFLNAENLDTTDFMIYSFLKYKCYRLKNNSYCISYSETKKELLISTDTFYKRIKKLKDKKLILVSRTSSLYNIDSEYEPNTYKFLGLPKTDNIQNGERLFF